MRLRFPANWRPASVCLFAEQSAAIGGQLDLGEAIYRNLAARQLAQAADFALERQHLDSLLTGAQGFDLVLACAAILYQPS